MRHPQRNARKIHVNVASGSVVPWPLEFEGDSAGFGRENFNDHLSTAAKGDVSVDYACPAHGSIKNPDRDDQTDVGKLR